MPINLNLGAELEQKLQQEAFTQGLSSEQYALQVFVRHILVAPATIGVEDDRIERFKDKDTADAWFDYAKQRFDEVNGRLDTLRSNARQMIAWIAAAIGLELTYLPKILDPEAIWAVFFLPCFGIIALFSMGTQMYALIQNAEIGYVYSKLKLQRLHRFQVVDKIQV